MTGERLAGLRSALRRNDVAAIVVTHLPNVRYLSGFTGSNARLLVTHDEVVLVTDGRYREQAEAELAASAVDARLVVSAEPAAAALRDVVAACPDVAVESTTSWADVRSNAEDWRSELVPLQGTVEALRAVKDDAEQAALWGAAALADASLAAALEECGPDTTEAGLALAIEWEMRTRGAESTAFDLIVAAGPHGALPHATPRRTALGRDTMVVVDFGCVLDGYCSDCTRTFCWGEPHPDLASVWDVVAAAQDSARAAVAAGAATRAVDAAAREVIADAGFGDAFVHGTGHGVGLEIHELPRVTPRSDEVLAAGMVVTVEPGVYLPGLGGVRLEDTVVVTDDGCETLTGSPRRMRVG